MERDNDRLKDSVAELEASVAHKVTAIATLTAEKENTRLERHAAEQRLSVSETTVVDLEVRNKALEEQLDGVKVELGKNEVLMERAQTAEAKCREELTAITVHEELQTAALLVLANKQAARVFSACALGAASAASRLAGPRHGPCGEAAGSPRAPPPRHLLRGQLVACRLALVAWRL